MKKKLLLALALVVITVLVAMIIATPKIEPEPPLPSPNGYDDFLKAAAMLEANPPDWQGMSGEEQHEVLKKLVATNRAAIDLLRAGLAKESRVVPYEVNETNGTHLTQLAGCKRLAQALSAASRLALIEGRTNEAAAFATDCIRYGNGVVRGGVLIDSLVGLAVKNIGLSSLKSAMPGLDLEGTRNTLAALDAAQARSESIDDILKRERQWARRGRFGNVGIVSQIVSPFLNRKVFERARQKFAKIENDTSRMKLQLAARAFELEQGKPPVTAQELVPKYLKAAPLDAETGKELPLN